MIHITKSFLQNCEVDALAYGAKDTGEMGGGAASAIIKFAGPEIVKSLKKALVKSTRQIGEVVLTDSFSLKQKNIKYILHVISIIKNTPEGAYCPQPKKLEDGVYKALKLASLLALKSVAFSALGTGEGRVKSRESAQYMLDATYRFLNEKHIMDIYFALPDVDDYHAFSKYYSLNIQHKMKNIL